jgi:hypothetical protein
MLVCVAFAKEVQVAFVLKRLLRQTRITSESSAAGPADAVISDRGAEFQVTVAGQERTFVDPARSCAERAQNAAVFVGIVLDPPMIAEPPAPAPPPPVAPPPAPTPEQRRPLQAPIIRTNAMDWDFTLKGLLAVAPATPERETAVAVGASAWVRGKRTFHLGFGAGVLRGALHFKDVAADAWWIPLDIAIGFTGQTGPWELSGEIGPNASVLSIVGRDLRDASAQVRLEVGGRASLGGRFWFSEKFALFVSAEGLIRPMPYALQIAPDGEIGQMPTFWMGGAAGLSAALE